MNKSYVEKIKNSSDFIRKTLVIDKKIKNAIILGVGFRDFLKDIKIDEIEFEKIPHFPFKNHNSGSFFIVNNTLVIDTFLYSYNGYSLKEASYIMRIIQNLNIENVFYFEEAVSLDDDKQLQIITDQINLFGDNPLIGKNHDELGLRFPDMSYPYSQKLNEEIKSVCNKKGFAYKTSVCVGIKGPTLATNAEKVFFRKIGADAVVFSILGEVIVASHAKLNNCAVLCPKDSTKKVREEFKQVIRSVLY